MLVRLRPYVQLSAEKIGEGEGASKIVIAVCNVINNKCNNASVNVWFSIESSVLYL